MNDLDDVRNSVLSVFSELEQARRLIKSQAAYDKALHRYESLLNGTSEELVPIREIESELYAASIERDLAKEYFQRVADDKN